MTWKLLFTTIIPIYPFHTFSLSLLEEILAQVTSEILIYIVYIYIFILKKNSSVSTTTCQAVSDVSCCFRDTDIMLWIDPIISLWPARPTYTEGTETDSISELVSFSLRFD